METAYQEKMITTFKLYPDLKEIDSILVILKESKSLREKKKEKKSRYIMERKDTRC